MLGQVDGCGHRLGKEGQLVGKLGWVRPGSSQVNANTGNQVRWADGAFCWRTPTADWQRLPPIGINKVEDVEDASGDDRQGLAIGWLERRQNVHLMRWHHHW